MSSKSAVFFLTASLIRHFLFSKKPPLLTEKLEGYAGIVIEPHDVAYLCTAGSSVGAKLQVSVGGGVNF